MYILYSNARMMSLKKNKIASVYAQDKFKMPTFYLEILMRTKCKAFLSLKLRIAWSKTVFKRQRI